MSLGTFRINAPDVVTEVFDNDLVVLNLRSGVCVNLAGQSKALVQLVTEGVAADSLIALLAAEHKMDVGVLREAVEALVENQMIVPQTDAPARSARPEEAAEVAAAGESFEVDYFTDFSDLLASDPIHDADPGTGWPLQSG